MSKVLLDTHVLIWAIASPDRLSARARTVMTQEPTVLLVSAASAWEIATKFRLGKLPDAELLLDTWDEALARLKADQLPIDADQARRAGLYATAHRDPFDRLLAAQAELIGVPLVTTDGAFIEFPISTIW